ncbi:MAG TPA: DUF4166 domain-containing protein [Allosphingosinicella sp.]|nr:DUF4166 domain-containing protein [Allosphingosinicella sp.]
MIRVLVLGGYGTFGGRIALRGAAAGFEILVAGRSLERAEAFCAGRERLVPVALDGGLAATLDRHRPFALVDAAGPFQGADYDVARAAIAAGCHYLDIADGSDFVAGIGILDSEARAAGVSAISGASSVPALSAAASARLAEGLERVAAVEMALSASSRGTAGRSVAAAILSYLGRPVRLRRGGRWTRAFGWQGLRRIAFEAEGAAPLRGRLVALADVPDLALLPGRLPGRPAVSFLAGTDAPWHNLGLWLMSWTVRWGWLRRPERLAGLLSALQRWTRGPGSLRSAFEVRLWGIAGGRRVERRWTLIAGRGDGPEIPSLAVPLLLTRLAAGELPPGARDSGGLLTLEDFEPGLAALASVRALTERTLQPPLYARVMGERFDTLPPSVRAVHEVLRDGGAAGEARVTGGLNPIARSLAAMMGFPGEGTHPLHVAFAERDGRERWTRDFSGRTFSSVLEERQGRLTERFGPVRFAFDLPSDSGGLRMVIRRWWLGPLPLPLFLAPRSEAREWEEEGRFHFDVPIALPLLGPLVHYRGWLEPAEASPHRPNLGLASQALPASGHEGLG